MCGGASASVQGPGPMTSAPTGGSFTSQVARSQACVQRDACNGMGLGRGEGLCVRMQQLSRLEVNTVSGAYEPWQLYCLHV